MYLEMLRMADSNIKGKNAVFISCGRIGNVIRNNAASIPVTPKYFFTNGCFFKTKNDITAWVGRAHNTLKLSLHNSWSVPNHINNMKQPINPRIRKYPMSNTSAIFCAPPVLMNVSITPITSSTEVKSNGVNQESL